MIFKKRSSLLSCAFVLLLCLLPTYVRHKFALRIQVDIKTGIP